MSAVPSRNVTVLLAGLVVVSLAVGTWLLTRSQPFDAASHVRSLYATGDPEVVLDAILPGSIPDDVQTLMGLQLGAAFANDVSVLETSDVEIRGTTVERVATSDGLHWCVRDDGQLLAFCRLGTLDLGLEVRTGDVAVRSVFGDLYDDRAEFGFVVEPTQADPFAFPGTLVLQESDGSAAGGVTLLSLTEVVDGQAREVAPADVRLAAGGRLLVHYQAATPQARDALIGRHLVLAWQSGAIDLRVSVDDWFVG